MVFGGGLQVSVLGEEALGLKQGIYGLWRRPKLAAVT